jgi:hypothetical protein
VLKEVSKEEFMKVNASNPLKKQNMMMIIE